MKKPEPQVIGLFFVVLVMVEAIRAVDREPLTTFGYFLSVWFIAVIGISLFHFLVERFRKKDRIYFFQSFTSGVINATVDGHKAHLVYPNQKAFAEAKKRYSGDEVPSFETKAGA